MELVVFLGEDKENFSQAVGLVKKGDWERVIVVGERVEMPKESEFVSIDREARLIDMKEEIRGKLKGKISGTEVSLSIASGNGKEHMALISALLSIPVGIRFTALTRDGIVEI
jgi:hypothetical protein